MNKPRLYPWLALCAAAVLAGKPPAVAEEKSDGRSEARHSSKTPAADLMHWVAIPGGSFMMGSENNEQDEKPVHPVTIRTLDMAKTAVTFRQYRACVEAGACTPPHISDGTCMLLDDKGGWRRGNLPATFQGGDQPVVCVDWGQAKAFSEWAGGRLPTEAEWEYAARSAGKNQKYPWGNEKATCKRAVMSEGVGRFKGPGARGCGRNATWPVCSKPEGNTRQGLCDMLGNVWQWTQDCYHASYEGAPRDGSAWVDPVDAYRVHRGLSWYHTDKDVRAENRCHDKPGSTESSMGFRPVRDRP